MIYLDHNATAPMLTGVREAMLPWLGIPANPASVHRAGQQAAVAVERAREQVAALVGGEPSGVVFTSGATEANHMALRGAAHGLSADDVIAISAIEHPCVFAAAESTGCRVTAIPVDAQGRVLVDAIPAEARVVSVMAVNHETGVIQDTEAVAERFSGRAFFHVDAVQAVGRIAVRQGAVDAMVLSSHKLGGPAGVGAVVLRDGEPFPNLLGGGAQERGRRGGTVNVAGVVGFGVACALAQREREARQAHYQRLAQVLRPRLVSLGARIVGEGAARVPSVTTVVFPGVIGETVVQSLDLAGICVSHGAACASGSLEPSPVLLAMGDPEPRGGVRLSMGPHTTLAEIDATCAALERMLPLLASGL